MQIGRIAIDRRLRRMCTVDEDTADGGFHSIWILVLRPENRQYSFNVL